MRVWKKLRRYSRKSSWYCILGLFIASLLRLLVATCVESCSPRLWPQRGFTVCTKLFAAVLSRKKVSGRILEVIIGHATFVALTNRGLLSIFNTVYRFIRSNYHTPTILWKTVREELFVFRSLMIYLHADWGRQWNNYVTASDSSLTGYGVVSSYWDREDVARVGRLQERSRFRKLGAHSARESALTSAGFVRDEVSNEWIAGWLDDDDYLKLAGWALNKDFQEVPAQLLRRDMWTPRLWGRWKHSAGILELEARALVMSLRRIALSIYGHDLRQLLLTDNMSVCLSFDRSRAKSYALLRQIRVFTAYCLSRNISCTIRWVPSELNSADEPSRLDSSEDSKTLVHAIPAVFKSPEGAIPSSSTGEKADSRPQETSPLTPLRVELFEGREDPFTQKVVCGESFGDPEDPWYIQLDGCHTGHSASFEEAPERFFNGLHQLHTERQEEEVKGIRSASGQEVQVLSGSDNGAWQHDFVGGTCYQASDSTPVSYAVEGVHGLCALPWGEPGRSDGGGQGLGRPHEHTFHGGSAELPCRSPLSRLPPHLPTVWEEWTPQAAPLLACHQGVSEVDSRKESQSSPLGSMGSLCRRDEEKRIPQDGHLLAPRRINLCQALGIVESPGLFIGEAGGRSHKGLVNAPKPRGGRGDHKDRRVRHQRAAGFTLDGQLGQSGVRTSEEEPPRKPSLGFRLPRLQQGLSRSGKDFQRGSNPLPDQTQWPKHRPFKKLSKSAGGTEERTVESTEKHHEVREGSPACQHVVLPAPEIQGSRNRMRGRPWGDLAGPKARTHLQRRRCVANRYVMDLFSGEGGVARACTELGFRSKEWDIRHGDQHDLTNPKVVKKLIREAKRGRVLSCMLAPVCTSFSIARDRTKVIRNRQHPWGIPQQFLTEKERQSIQLGNKCFKTCLKLMKVFDSLHIPYILENPLTSKAWRLPEMMSHAQSPFISMIRADFCQFGTCWRKPTLFMCARCDPTELHRVSKTCSGPRGQCCRTKAPHFQLTGSCRDGRPWTQVAQPYPKALCRALGHVLTSNYHLISANKYFEWISFLQAIYHVAHISDLAWETSSFGA